MRSKLDSYSHSVYSSKMDLRDEGRAAVVSGRESRDSARGRKCVHAPVERLEEVAIELPLERLLVLQQQPRFALKDAVHGAKWGL